MKSRWRSKTHWFNFIMAMLALAEANLQMLQPALGPSVYAYISFALIMGNMALREITKEPLR